MLRDVISLIMHLMADFLSEIDLTDVKEEEGGMSFQNRFDVDGCFHFRCSFAISNDGSPLGSELLEQLIEVKGIDVFASFNFALASLNVSLLGSRICLLISAAELSN